MGGILTIVELCRGKNELIAGVLSTALASALNILYEIVAELHNPT